MTIQDRNSKLYRFSLLTGVDSGKLKVTHLAAGVITATESSVNNDESSLIDDKYYCTPNLAVEEVRTFDSVSFSANIALILVLLIVVLSSRVEIYIFTSVIKSNLDFLFQFSSCLYRAILVILLRSMLGIGIHREQRQPAESVIVLVLLEQLV